MFNVIYMHFLGVGKKTPSETSRLAECVGDTRSLLWKILADSHRNLAACRQQAPGNNKYHVPDELSKFQVFFIFRKCSVNNNNGIRFLQLYVSASNVRSAKKFALFCRN